ncbi:MAG: 30S ribosomal protein S17 [Candidatus Pacebacteria bacterium]|nr:30S ribosomal protein S17 [Candidatus Paceibacterota bacterium]
MKKLIGEVVSDKMNKTRVIEIIQWKKNEKYLKYFKVSKRFKAHDEKNEFKMGDKVEIIETRPISRDKRWAISKKI